MTNREMTEVILSTHNESAQARILGVSRGRLQRWKKDPESIPLWAVRKLAELKGYRVIMETIPHTYT